MTTLNKSAKDAMIKYDVHACTDVTGFGLMGHLLEMVQGSDVQVRVDISGIDMIPEALEFARMGVLPAGMYRNRSYAEANVDLTGIPLEKADLLFDPQTSGGLLICVSPDDADTLWEELKTCVPSAQRIGGVYPYNGGKRIVVE
jgi:selenide,water dikinase